MVTPTPRHPTIIVAQAVLPLASAPAVAAVKVSAPGWKNFK